MRLQHHLLQCATACVCLVPTLELFCANSTAINQTGALGRDRADIRQDSDTMLYHARLRFKAHDYLRFASGRGVGDLLHHRLCHLFSDLMRWRH
jgi:hypothetical protein